MTVSRRSFLTGLAAVIAAPAVIRIPGLLMPVRAIVQPKHWTLEEYGRGYEIIENDDLYLVQRDMMLFGQAWWTTGPDGIRHVPLDSPRLLTINATPRA